MDLNRRRAVWRLAANAERLFVAMPIRRIEVVQFLPDPAMRILLDTKESVAEVENVAEELAKTRREHDQQPKSHSPPTAA